MRRFGFMLVLLILFSPGLHSFNEEDFLEIYPLMDRYVTPPSDYSEKIMPLGFSGEGEFAFLVQKWFSRNGMSGVEFVVLNALGEYVEFESIDVSEVSEPEALLSEAWERFGPILDTYITEYLPESPPRIQSFPGYVDKGMIHAKLTDFGFMEGPEAAFNSYRLEMITSHGVLSAPLRWGPRMLSASVLGYMIDPSREYIAVFVGEEVADWTGGKSLYRTSVFVMSPGRPLE